MRKLFGGLALVAAVAVLPAAAQAQTPLRFGAQLSYGDDSDLGVGVRVKADTPRLIPGAPLSLIGSFDWFFPGNNVDYFELNGNVAYNFAISGSPLRPYAGGGLNFTRISRPVFGSGTDIGLNLLGGINFRSMGRLAPFAEIRLELGGGEQFVLSGGFYF